jgi:hypothetical protein
MASHMTIVWLKAMWNGWRGQRREDKITLVDDEHIDAEEVGKDPTERPSRVGDGPWQRSCWSKHMQCDQNIGSICN